MALAETEALLYRFLFRKLEWADLKQMTRHELEDEVDEETMEEIKDHVFQMLWRQVHWAGLLSRLRSEKEEESEPETEEEAEDGGW